MKPACTLLSVYQNYKYEISSSVDLLVRKRLESSPVDDEPVGNFLDRIGICEVLLVIEHGQQMHDNSTDPFGQKFCHTPLR